MRCIFSCLGRRTQILYWCARLAAGVRYLSGYILILGSSVRLLIFSNKALAKGGITPTDNNTYTTTQITSAIKGAYGADPLLGCVYSNELREEILVAIGLCIDKGLRIFQCDPR